MSHKRRNHLFFMANQYAIVLFECSTTFRLKIYFRFDFCNLQYLNSGLHSKSQKSPKMKFIHILIVIFMSFHQSVNCHKSDHSKISSQFHLNAFEYIVVWEMTKRFDLRKEKLEKQSEITMTRKAEKKDVMRQVRHRQRWHYYDQFLFWNKLKENKPWTIWYEF